MDSSPRNSSNGLSSESEDSPLASTELFGKARPKGRAAGDFRPDNAVVAELAERSNALVSKTRASRLREFKSLTPRKLLSFLRKKESTLRVKEKTKGIHGIPFIPRAYLRPVPNPSLRVEGFVPRSRYSGVDERPHVFQLILIKLFFKRLPNREKQAIAY